MSSATPSVTSSSMRASIAICLAVSLVNSSPGSMWRWISAAGSVSATSSTSIPPILERIARSFFSERSRMIDA